MLRFFSVACLATLIPVECPAEDDPRSGESVQVDAKTLHHKVLCGYQGWFRCPGDGTGDGWRHWSRRRNELTPQSLTVEMWPDLSDFSPGEKYRVPGFTHPDGGPAYLFSSANSRTVLRHFQWMQQYGIDGVFLQRFLVSLRRPSLDKVLENVRAAARDTGRIYAVCYDLSGMKEEQLLERLTEDWKRLVAKERLTRDDRYLHHRGKPVVFVWGFYSDRFDAAVAHRIIDFFHRDGPYQVTLIGGCPWHWRRERDADWARVFRRLDVLSPWNVGNVTRKGNVKLASTALWKDDRAELKKYGVEYLPVLYPGFGWTHLKGEDARNATIPRRGGEFFWEQFLRGAELEIDMAYVAMFDEVDEATAVFKVSNQPPTQAYFQTYENRPSDWYLRLTGAGTRLLRGEPVDVNVMK